MTIGSYLKVLYNGNVTIQESDLLFLDLYVFCV